MILGVKCAYSDEYFTGLRERLENPKGFGLTITGRVWMVKDWWVVKATPSLPEFYKLGIVGIVGSYLLMGLIGWWALIAAIPGIIMTCTFIFWTRSFYKIIIRLGLRKHYGKHHKIDSFLYGNKLLEAVLEWHNIAY